MIDNISPETVAAIAALGFDVYAPEKGLTSYLYFTDGTNIGYLQNDRFRGPTLSTVHVSNRTTGTGFSLDQPARLDRDELEKAFVIAPSWASGSELASVVKYADIAAFVKSERIVPLAQIAKGKSRG
jgi:hypothetical protein